MPVFDFNSTPDEKKTAECTYTVIRSNENEATAEKPMMVLDNKICQWDHHSCGVFTNPIKRTSFEFQQEDGTVSADILKIDARFVSLLKWLGENHINVRLSGRIQKKDMRYIRSARSHLAAVRNYLQKTDSFSL